MSNPNVSVIQRVLFTVINSEGMQQCRGLYRFLRTSMTKCEMNPMEYAHDMLTGRVREGTTHDIKQTVLVEELERRHIIPDSLESGLRSTKGVHLAGAMT